MRIVNRSRAAVFHESPARQPFFDSRKRGYLYVEVDADGIIKKDHATPTLKKLSRR